MLKGKRVEVRFRGTIVEESASHYIISSHNEPLLLHRTAISKLEVDQGIIAMTDITPIGPGDEVLTLNGLHGTVISADGPDAFVLIPAQQARGPSRRFTRFIEHRIVHPIETLRRRNAYA